MSSKMKGGPLIQIESKVPEAAGNPARAPAHELVYQRLRAQILFGEMAPGQAVTIQGLAESLAAGMTPVREAIRRLISDGALVFQGNRRVSVPTLTAADLEQLVYVRKSIESELARRSASRMKPADLARLSGIDRAVDTAIAAGDVAGYLQRNYDFHAAIYAVADAPVMTDLADRLWLRFGPSLRVVCGRFGTQNLPDRHKDMLAALGDGDGEAAARAMAQDVEQGMEMVAGVLAAAPGAN
ncbi:MAG: GntR family transcriptional regulator [Jhaorihella sp.]